MTVDEALGWVDMTAGYEWAVDGSEENLKPNHSDWECMQALAAEVRRLREKLKQADLPPEPLETTGAHAHLMMADMAGRPPSTVSISVYGTSDKRNTAHHVIQRIDSEFVEE